MQQYDRYPFLSSYCQFLVASAVYLYCHVLCQAGLPADRSNASAILPGLPSGYFSCSFRITVTGSHRTLTCFPFHRTKVRHLTHSNLACEICAPRADAVRHHLWLRTRAHPRGALYRDGSWLPPRYILYHIFLKMGHITEKRMSKYGHPMTFVHLCHSSSCLFFASSFVRDILNAGCVIKRRSAAFVRLPLSAIALKFRN